jgi:hypothetical protein
MGAHPIGATGRALHRSFGLIVSMKPISRVGKGALFAPCPHGYDEGGHAEPVIGPAEGRTRWLCPPYKSDGIDMDHEGIDMDHEGIDQARAVGSS